MTGINIKQNLTKCDTVKGSANAATASAQVKHFLNKNEQIQHAPIPCKYSARSPPLQY